MGEDSFVGSAKGFLFKTFDQTRRPLCFYLTLLVPRFGGHVAVDPQT